MSSSSPAIVSGAKTTSRSTVPFPSRPGKAEILPSNLLAMPLRTATGRPHPKSLSYIGNLGELPIVIIAPSKFPKGNNLGNGWDALDPVPKIERLHPLLQSMSAIDRHPKRCRFVPFQFPSPRHGSPQLSTQRLERRNLQSRILHSRAVFQTQLIINWRYLSVSFTVNSRFVSSELEFQNGFSAKMEDLLTQRLVAGESRRRSTFRELKHRL
ncbi:hypothetical protein H5410_044144 [Solanum commersonii]|uniref:Uncharacterized protein n=1 Tax=Solanum commersonii TaxID=4109 RepID=A0A9J5X8X3_SOLCO|nr:hypothetical protein H5410_044144 [Solanum commersonii]